VAVAVVEAAVAVAVVEAAVASKPGTGRRSRPLLPLGF
jgi:hypothetical protein